MMKDLNVRPDTIKLLEDNKGRTLFVINHSKIFFDPPPGVMEIKINKWDLIKLKSFCTGKEMINKTKRQSKVQEKIFANGKGLISKIYKLLFQYYITKQSNQKMGRRSKYTFLQRRYTDYQQTLENMFNITSNYRNANKNYNEVTSHTGKNSHHQKVYR